MNLWVDEESALVNPMRGHKHVFDVASYERNMGRHRQYIDARLAHWQQRLTFIVNNKSY